MFKNQIALVPVNETFYIGLADSAPALNVDPSSPTFSWQDIYVDNYWNTENLASRRDALGGWPVVTIDRVSIEQVQVDPESPNLNKAPDLVIAFNEYNLRMVCNKTRCKAMAKLAGTPNPAYWAQNLQGVKLELYVGKDTSMSNVDQVLIQEAPAPRPNRMPRPADAPTVTGRPITIDQANDELFS